MNQTKLEISVGAFVIVGLAAVAYVALKIGAGLLVGTDTYLVSARFNNVSGLSAGGKIAIAGVTVGSVERIDLDLTDYSAVVTLRMRQDVALPTDSIVSVRSNGLLGDKYLAIQPGADEETVATDGKGRLIETVSAVDLESLISRFAFGSVNDKGKESAPNPDESEDKKESATP